MHRDSVPESVADQREMLRECGATLPTLSLRGPFKGSIRGPFKASLYWVILPCSLVSATFATLPHAADASCVSSMFSPAATEEVVKTIATCGQKKFAGMCDLRPFLCASQF